MSLTMNRSFLLKIVYSCLKREYKMVLKFGMQMDLSATHYTIKVTKINV